MRAKLKNTGMNLEKVDAHIITAEEYDELPELTDAFFAEADLYHGNKLVRRGRPAGSSKISTTVRFDADVINAFRNGGKGWQTRMNSALREWITEHPGQIG